MLRAAELHGVHTAAGPSVHESLQELDPPKHLTEFFLEVESNFEHVNLDSSTAVLRQLLLSLCAHIELLTGASSIDWNEVEQRELFAEAKRLQETGELFPRGTAEELHAPDAEAEASDSEPEEHVMEPLADDHSSNGEDTSTGVEESAAPPAPAVAAAPERAAMSLLERLQAIRIFFSVPNHHHDSTLPLCRSQNELGVTSARVHVRVNRVVVVCCCFPVHPFCLCNCCFHSSSSSSPVPSLALRMGSNDQCDGNQCCPSLGGCLCRHHQEWSWRLDLTQHGKTHQVLTYCQN